MEFKDDYFWNSKWKEFQFQTLLDPCVTPVLEAPGDSAEPGDRFQDFKVSRFQDFIQVLEEESVRFRGHQAEVAMITITACSYLTLVDPKQQQHIEKWYYDVGGGGGGRWYG